MLCGVVPNSMAMLYSEQTLHVPPVYVFMSGVMCMPLLMCVCAQGDMSTAPRSIKVHSHSCSTTHGQATTSPVCPRHNTHVAPPLPSPPLCCT
jgi:hypothetical protein